MICPVCGQESGALVNTCFGTMCPRCRDFGPGGKRPRRKAPRELSKAYTAEAGVLLCDARSKIASASLGALSEGDINTAEVLNGLTYRLDEILAIVDEIIAVRK